MGRQDRAGPPPHGLGQADRPVAQQQPFPVRLFDALGLGKGAFPARSPVSGPAF